MGAGTESRERVRTLLALCAIAAALSCASACSISPVSRNRSAHPPSTASLDLVVAATTDVHGRVRSWDYFTNKVEPSRGLSRAATIVDSLRRSSPGRVVLLDAGDLLQGNPFSYMVAHAPELKSNTIVAVMNSMQYDASAIGNHEFNYGIPNLNAAAAQANFPFLSANIYKPDGSHAYKPWTIITREGVRIAIIGATTPGVVLWDAESVRGQLTFGDIVPAVREAVTEVKAAGANVVIVDIHSGLDEPSSYDTVATNVPSENVAARVAGEVPGIDLVLYGHSHKEMKGKFIGSALLVQPRNWATSVSVAHLHLDRSAAGWSVTRKSAELIQAAGHEESARILALSEQAHQLTLAHFNAVIGTTPTAWPGDSSRLKDTPLLDFVLETERRISGADLASSAAFATDVVLGPGAVTAAQVAHLYPYDNTLRVIRINGKQLRDYLDFSSRYYTGRRTATGALETDPLVASYNFDIVAGVDYTIDLTKPIGSRITRLVYRGKAVNDSDSFTFALSNYRQGGGGGFSMVAGSPVLREIQTIVPEFLIEEVKRRGVLKQEDYFTPSWNIVAPPLSPSVH